MATPAAHGTTIARPAEPPDTAATHLLPRPLQEVGLARPLTETQRVLEVHAERRQILGQAGGPGHHHRLLADWAAGLAVPAVMQLDDPGAGDQVELVGLGDVVEEPGALARHVGEQGQVELVDQVEPHERPPEADAAPDHDA